MIKPEDFYNELKKNNVNFYTGVPDSLLKEFCAYITSNASESNHIINTSEGSAIGMAIGRHMATGEVPVVYMQNSGLGNIINPILSLADEKVYGIPMILIIGWRGEPGVKDEPQHIKQGEITLDLLDVMGIEYQIIDKNSNNIESIVKKVVDNTKKYSNPTAIIVRKGTFAPYKLESKDELYDWNREDAIKTLLNYVNEDFIVSTTGKASREVFEARESRNEGHGRDFLTVGGMGHASQIACGISMSINKRVWCFDGDGAALMHLGAAGISAIHGKSNFIHILLNNFAHDSVGGQPTIADQIHFPNIFKNLGYKQAFSVKSESELKTLLDRLPSDGPILIEVKINSGARKDLGRPTTTPLENKLKFIINLKNDIK
jgi:phosphonopyruvate decarboxylase